MKLFAFFSMVLVLSCSTQTKKETPQAAVSANLTQEAAEQRHSQVEKVRYTLALDLTSPDKLSGTAEIHFRWLGSAQDLRIDFYKGEIQGLQVNSKDTSFSYDGVGIYVSAKAFSPGENLVKINFSRAHSTDGRGLNRFEDPVDKRVYFFTQFEPYYANYMFPCFDQPDLKATYTLDVKAAPDWEVITSVRESKKTPNANGLLWEFPESALFSTYIFSLHAGPYKVWKGGGKIPLRLFARQSMSQYVDYKGWFDTTTKGLNFFSKYFEYPYPFKKLDQVIHPIMGGAMENVGAITYGEWSIPRGETTWEHKRGLSSTILHELAHMWFGDIVTMKWWNDLWLNESFATFLGYTSLQNATRFKDTWLSVNGVKVSIIQADEMVTTHPVEAPVKDALEARSVFDRITYGKGASALKQLDYYLQPENFRKGTAKYIKKFEWKNTIRDDFMKSLSESSGKNLSEWQDQWLRTAGVNTLETIWECQNEKISKFEIRQSASARNPILRTHAFEIGLLNAKANVFKKQRTEVSGDVTQIKELLGLACPAAVFPNLQDYGYFNIRFDAKSLEFFKLNAGKIDDFYLRKLVWSTLWKMVEDAQLDFQTFGKIGLAALAVEKERNIFYSLAYSLSYNVINYYYHSGLEGAPTFSNYVATLEDIIEKRMNEAQGEVKMLWFDLYIESSHSKARLEKLSSILQGKSKVSGFVLDQDRRWAILNRLAIYNYPQAQQLAATEASKDNSFAGKKEKLGVEAAIPDIAQKNKWIAEFKNASSAYTLPEFAVALRRLFPVQQRALHQTYYKTFFEDLTTVRRTKDFAYQITFASALVPQECSSQTSLISDFLRKESTQDPTVRKVLLEASDTSKRCGEVVRLAKEKNP